MLFQQYMVTLFEVEHKLLLHIHVYTRTCNRLYFSPKSPFYVNFFFVGFFNLGMFKMATKDKSYV